MFVQEPIPYHLLGFATEDDAKAAGLRVSQVIDEVAQELGIKVAGLDGVTIASDYDVALANLDLGYETQRPLTRTNDEAAGGVAMTPFVKRDGKVLSHIVLNAGVVALIDMPANGVSGKYIVAHELAHVHEHYIRDKVLPNTFLRQLIPEPDEAFLFDVADACWSEYAACTFSAAIHPAQASLYEITFVAVLRLAKDKITQAKKQWMIDGDFAKVWQRVAPLTGDLLKYASYLLGHAAGLNKPLQEIAPEAWQLLQSEGWLLPRISELEDCLANMMETFADWRSLDAFEPLKKVVRDQLADCGITMKGDKGRLRIFVSEGALPVSECETDSRISA
jgi:hypothetical protein